MSSVIFTVLGKTWKIFATHATYFYGQEKITTLLIALCLFMVFATLKMNYSKWINHVASATFGVYLLHDNKFARLLLWIELFNNSQYQESMLLIPYSIIAVTMVYIVCTLIDLLRQQVVEKPLMVMVNRYSD
jgi:surface polysaccharide O-acyltransferase-like enzyme